MRKDLWSFPLFHSVFIIFHQINNANNKFQHPQIVFYLPFKDYKNHLYFNKLDFVASLRPKKQRVLSAVSAIHYFPSLRSWY